ncbi:cyclopropane-fatty-acyl-phospholipid synthase family protein [Pseudooceanicola sp.]|uniref:SAM-dependent methyltransferase n=1 Tax=Pseudooceanicola sp. TaxID=1914328 RepID=UPI00263A28C3|nr:cyclopropane-fatty-acyl-phospholipid synthase family protein [Pseudooceanicola sp.]MDF1856571.1 cyclopropane-fatty-acyl-phospholipid synthase [Pseudooceanicola sp.]
MLFLTKRVKHDFLETCGQIRIGSLRLRTPEGEVYDFGQGSPSAEMQIYDWSVISAIAGRGDIGLGETYVAGLWETPSIADLTEVALKNLDEFRGYAYAGFWNSVKFRVVNRLMRANSTRGAARNIRAHYDVGNEFYQLWLDESMTYSSAMFAPGDHDLHRAQNRKYDRILQRLGAGERVLEIGCGWGGFAERAADSGHDVTGLTISPSQKGYADARLDGRADIRLQDYRKSSGKFDSIVSIEMIEAVGEDYWPTYFATLKSRLAEHGRAMIQAITVPDGYFDTYRRSSDYIRHYTFPGGMLLSNAVIAEQARRAGLTVRDSHAFGADYSRTCAIWGDRLDQQADRIRRLGYDEGFLRNWRYYLGICAASFAAGQTDVVQVELTHA